MCRLCQHNRGFNPGNLPAASQIGISTLGARNSPMAPESTEISRAIEAHYALWWTDEMKAAILADVGPEGLALIEEISSFANDPDIWIYGSTQQSYEDVQALLRQKYDFLSDASVSRIASAAAYGWK